MMKTSITAIESASWHTPLVLRGDHISCIRQAAQCGYEGIELHLKDSDAWTNRHYVLRLRRTTFL